MVTLAVGEQSTLCASVTPTGAAIAWASENASVATVSASGVVRAVGPGETYVSATAGAGIARCKVSVGLFPVQLQFSEVAMNKGTRVLRAPIGCTVRWASDTPAVAAVSAKGKITAKALGSATITCTVIAVSNRADAALRVGDRGKLTLYVRPKRELVTRIEPSRSTLRLAVGDTQTLHFTLKPARAPDRRVFFESDAPWIACVDAYGVVTGVSPGSTSITLYASSGKKAVVALKVTQAAPAIRLRVRPKSKTLRVGQTLTLRVETQPVAPVFFESDKPRVATVDADGVVTARAKGRAVLTVRVSDGGRAKVALVVKPAKR